MHRWRILRADLKSSPPMTAPLEDSQGRPQVESTNDRESRRQMDKGHAIQLGKDAQGKRFRVNDCLEMIKAYKRNGAPSGVVMDETKIGLIGISDSGQYTEGQQFIRTGEVLGKVNRPRTIVVVEDMETEIEHAMKMVMISEFSPNEVYAMVDLGHSDHFPSLYLFRLEANKVALHMEKVEHGVTLDDIINSHMANLREKAPQWIRPFCLFLCHNLMSAVGEMHNKNWTHRDLHGGNVMITKDTMMLKILDFGTAWPLREGSKFNSNALKYDILNIIWLICRVYTGHDLGSSFVLERKIEDGTLEKVLTETANLSKEEREELLQLIMMTYQVTQNPHKAGYGSTAPVMECIEDRLFPDKMRDVMVQVAPILFPDFYRTARDIALRGEGDVEVDEMTDDSVLEDAAKESPDDRLLGLTICSEEDV